MTADMTYDANVKPTRWEYLVVFIFIYISGECNFFGANADHTATAIKDIVTLYLFFPILLFSFIKRKNSVGESFTKPLLILTAFAFFEIMSALWNDNLMLGYFSRIMLISSGMLYAFLVPMKRFMRCFEDIIFLFSFVSIIIHFIYITVPGAFTIFPVFFNTNTDGGNFYNLFFTTIPTFKKPGLGLRLYSFFREPGVYQMYANLALLFHITSNQKLSLKKVVVYVLAILLTFSTAGYIVLAFVMLSFLLTRDDIKIKWKKTAIFLFGAIAIAFIVIRTGFLTGEHSILAKITSDTSNSAIARMASIQLNIRYFLSSPIFGVGITPLSERFLADGANNYFVTVMKNPNTLLVQFAAHGLFFGLLWLAGYVRCFKSLFDKKLPYLCALAGMILMLFGENLTENILMYILIGYGYVNTFGKRQVL